MMAVFLTALVIGLGAFAVQLVGGHDSDAGGHDTHAGDGHDSPILVLASIRFWAFALLTFGLVGTLLRLFHFAGRLESAIIATVAGLTAGYVSAVIIKRLQGQGVASVAGGDVVGRVGRVIVPPSAEAHGKVRISVGGSVVDYVARSDESLDTNETVIVEECEGGEVRVSRAPKELAVKE